MKRHNGWLGDVFGCGFVIIFAVIFFVAAAVITKWIWNSDLPDWLKFLLLR